MSVPQIEEEVKDKCPFCGWPWPYHDADRCDGEFPPAVPGECEIPWCHDPAYEGGLCWEHWKAEKVAEWDDEATERATCLAGVGAGSYIWGDRYKEREARILWRELKRVYPDLAPPDERTPEQRREDAAKAITELFG